MGYFKKELASLDKLGSRVTEELSDFVFIQLKKQDVDNYWKVENVSERGSLPLYSVIPAAKIENLTKSINFPSKDSLKKWHRSHQNNSSLRFSTLNQVNNKNVDKLRKAWEYRSNDLPKNSLILGAAVTIQANPIVINGIIYTPTVGDYIVAIDAINGKEVWRYKTPSRKPAQRGLVYNNGKIIFTNGKYLVSLNAKTGKPTNNFGENGTVKSKFMSRITPIIFENEIITLNFRPGIESHDLNSGKLLWSYALNKKSEQRYGGKKEIISAGVPWSGFSLDQERKIIYFQRGNPRPNWDGTQRPGDNNHSNSVVAFDLMNKEILWKFQEIRHDIWDLDVASSPILTSINIEGKNIDVVVTTTKIGNTLILDRLTGKPIFDFRLKKSKASSIPGEKTAKYQPFLQFPEPFSKQEFSLNEVTNIGEENKISVIEQLNEANFGWFEPHSFDSESLESNDLILFGVHGGASWPGASVDPFKGILYVTSNDIPWRVKLYRAVKSINKISLQFKLNNIEGHDVFKESCSSCHGIDLGGKHRDNLIIPNIAKAFEKYSKHEIENIIIYGYKSMPSIGENLSDEKINKIVNYVFESGNLISHTILKTLNPWDYNYQNKYFIRFEDFEGFPASKPPWGKLTAINLNNGRILWSTPLGEYKKLTKRGIPITGTENYGGATATSGGLVFSAGTLDKKIRAFDSINGKELWSFDLPFASFTPVTIYEVNGIQYVLVTASGGGVSFDADPLRASHGDAFISFSLPSVE